MVVNAPEAARYATAKTERVIGARCSLAPSKELGVACS